MSKRSFDRRAFLKTALGAAAVPVLGAGSRRAYPQGSTPPLAEHVLRDDVTLVTGAGGNVVVLRAAGSAAVIDSGAPEHAHELAKRVRGNFGMLSVELLFNTHWHLDHTGGNEALRSGDTEIIAHELTRLWMATEYYVDWEDKTYAPREPAVLPTRTFHATDPQPLVVEIGDEEIEYGHLPDAHTDGDIYVWFKQRNVLAAGGVCTNGEYPVIDYATGGWIGGLVDATRKLLEMTNADTLIVPARGPAVPRSHLASQLEMLTVVRERIENLMRKGRSIAEMLEAGVTNEFDASWGANRERFVANIYHGLWWAGRLSDSL